MTDAEKLVEIERIVKGLEHSVAWSRELVTVYGQIDGRESLVEHNKTRASTLDFYARALRKILDGGQA